MRRVSDRRNAMLFQTASAQTAHCSRRFDPGRRAREVARCKDMYYYSAVHYMSQRLSPSHGRVTTREKMSRLSVLPAQQRYM
eukprot:9488141-Pyramimonas_sp.AAC.1